jgi:PAS domain S-box-containing protein
MTAPVLSATVSILLGSCVCAFALDPSLDISQYAHTPWKIRDGFTKGVIRAIAQTPDGYLWLGTEFGLLRFDGIRNELWQPPAGEQLPSSQISSLHAARDGRLWIGTRQGLASWKDGKLTLYPELAGQEIHVLEDHEHTIWAGAYYPPPARLCAIRGGNVNCHRQDGEFGGSVVPEYEDHAGNLWVGAGNGLWRWKPGTPRLYPLPDLVSTQNVLESENGVILIAVRAGIKQLVGDKITEFPLPGGLRFQPLRMIRDRDGGLWIGTLDRGLLHFHHGRVDVFSQSDGLSGNWVRNLFEDREGNIWVATDNGLDRFRDLAVSTFFLRDSSSQTRPWSLLAAKDGSVWVGTPDGLNRLMDGQATIYRKRSSGLPDDSIQSLFQDDRRRVWVSTAAGIAYFEEGKFIPVTGSPQRVHGITEGAAGNIWISQEESLLRVQGGRVLERFPWTSLGRKTSADVMLLDPLWGGLWLGFQDGTGLAYLKDGGIRASYGAAQGLGKGRVGSLQLDSDGMLWASTEGGLSRLKDGRIDTLTTKNGLPCNSVSWTIEDGDHSFWLYTACGLVRVARAEVEAWGTAVDKDKDTNRKIQATVFDNSDGVRSQSLPWDYTPQAGVSPDGRLWFLPGDGVSVVDPRHLRFNQLPPPVHIERIIADGKRYDAASSLRLPARVRNLAIDFTALSLAVPEKVHFRFKLDGQDQDWREVVNQRRVEYSNLPPGNHRFRVIACNNSGVWNETGDTLDFSIDPAYYQTNWFRALCATAFLAVLWGLHTLRLHQLTREYSAHLQGRVDAVEGIPAMTFTTLPDGSSTFVNKRWTEYTGLSVGETAGAGWERAVHPEDLPRHSEKWRVSIATGHPFEDESRFRRASDGEYRWFLVRSVPLRDEHGKILRWYGTLTDIEDRKRAEDALRRSEAYLADAQRLTHTGTWAYKAGEALYLSDENFRIWGFDQRQGSLDPETLLQRIHPEDCGKVLEYSRKTLREKSDYAIEFRIVLPDGRVRHIHAVGHQVFDASGEPVEFVGTHVDVTERKRAEEERERLRQLEADLAHMNRVSMLGELAASLSHELKQPIAAALTNANTSLRWMKRDPPDVEKAREATLRIVNDGTRAADIIDRVRSLYKKGAPPDRELVDVNEVLREMLVLLRTEASRHSISMRTELAAKLAKATADRVQLQQVLLNLMLNGIEAMTDSGGELTVKSRLGEDGQLVISVSDTGVGLPAENTDRIFTAFFSTKPQGSGMGLTISGSIVEAHGGRLWATANPGRGATFHFTLPLAAGAHA